MSVCVYVGANRWSRAGDAASAPRAGPHRAPVQVYTGFRMAPGGAQQYYGVQADMVVYGTGFKKSYDLFDRLLQQKLPMERDGLYLYRNVVPPHLPDIAFVGSEVGWLTESLKLKPRAQTGP